MRFLTQKTLKSSVLKGLRRLSMRMESGLIEDDKINKIKVVPREFTPLDGVNKVSLSRKRTDSYQEFDLFERRSLTMYQNSGLGGIERAKGCSVSAVYSLMPLQRQ